MRPALGSDARCPRCSGVNRTGAKFCNECGAELADPGTAGLDVRTPASYTPRHLAEKILISRAAMEGERKQVTVLFCDLVNSTAIAERIGAEAMHGFLDGFFKRALDEVHRCDGTLNQFLGDGFMALFGAPLAHEDDAKRAVVAALAIQNAVRQLPPPGPGIDVRVRIGVNTGSVVVGKIGDDLRMDYTAIGDTTNTAARLQALASPGATYISEATYRAVRDAVECEERGLHAVKGKQQPLTVYSVTGLRPRPLTARRTLTSPLVGRRHELDAFQAMLERLTRGHGGVLGVFGDAGIGKSRLIDEARRASTTTGAVTWLEGGALSFGRAIAYWPLLEILRALFELSEGEGESAACEKVLAHVRRSCPQEADDVAPYILALLTLPVPASLQRRLQYLDADALGRQVTVAVGRLLERCATAQPLVLVFEDLQWADESTLELLVHLLPKLHTVPLLLCGVTRSDSRAPATSLWGAAAGLGTDAYRRIALEPLGHADARSLVGNLLHEGERGEQLTELVYRKTEGNPFFVEEVVRSLIDTGTIVRDSAGGGWRLTRRVDHVDIPTTVQSLIRARIDRLEENTKQLVKVASVIGRTFLYRVLSVLQADADRVDRDLEELAVLELIHERRRVPELEYMFRHAVVQEVAYDSLLVQRRREIHRQVAACIELLFTNRLDEYFPLLAHHYGEAQAWEKAHEYLIKAGDQAGMLAADAEALEHYDRALESYARAFGDRWDAVERATVERKIGEALFRRSEHRRAVERLQSTLTLHGCPRLPETRWAIRLAIARTVVAAACRRLPGFRVRPHATERTRRQAEEQARVYEVLGWIDFFDQDERFVLDVLLMLEACERNDLKPGRAKALAALGIAFDALRMPRLAKRYLRHALTIADAIQQPVALGYAHLGMALVVEGEAGGRAPVLEHLRQAAEAYREAGDVRGAGTVMWQTAYVTFRAGDLPRARQLLAQVLMLGEESGDRQLRGWGLLDLGLVELCTTGPEAAISHLQQAIAVLAAVPDPLSVATARAYLGQAYVRLGRLDEATPEITMANAIVDQRGFGRWASPTKNARADLRVAVAERPGGALASDARAAAALACRAAVKQSRIARDGLSEALRVTGTLEWLSGHHQRARRRWDEAQASAIRMNTPYDAARVDFDRGRLTGSQADLNRAVGQFNAIGAAWDEARARGAMSGASRAKEQT